MKKFTLILFIITFFSFIGFSQTEKHNLESENLHKKVRKTIEHYYVYDKGSKGFVKKSVNIKRYNNNGNLAETYYYYNSAYSESTATKKMYYYDADDLLTAIKDISDTHKKYVTNSNFIYNKKGHLIKTEFNYKDGGKRYTDYKNDRKGKVINLKEFSKENKLTSETNNTYKGNKKTEIKTSYNSKDGSIIGTYTTVFIDDLKKSYQSNSKYGNGNTTYQYGKEKNLIGTNYNGKTNSTTTYNYVFDKKGNWVKKHSRSGKYQYFYFREIYFENGDVTGSSQFDRTFINRHGNFANVAIVPVKKKELKKRNYNTSSSTFKAKKWDYEYVYIKNEVKKLTGSAEIKTVDNKNLTVGSNTNFIVKFNESSFNIKFTVKSYKTYDDKYEYMFKNDKGATAILWIYKKQKGLEDEKLGVSFYVKGYIRIAEVDQPALGMYLK